MDMITLLILECLLPNHIFKIYLLNQRVGSGLCTQTVRYVSTLTG